MCFFKMQHWLIVCAIMLTGLSAGCRNRGTYCQPGCYSANPFNGIAGNTIVAPPATYSVQIPGQQNQYYNNSATAQQLPPLQPTGTLPSPNQGNVQSGWQPAGTLPVSTAPSSNATTQTPTPSSGLISVVDRGTGSLDNRLVQNTNQNGGLSRTDNTNFRSTAVDERLDRSRLPVTDASQVRAPTGFSPVTTVGQFAAPYYPPNQNPQSYQNGNSSYGQSIVANGQNVYQGNFAPQTFAQPSQQVYRGLVTQNPQVLGQSTVYADPANDPNFQNGWRDRELTAGRDSLSR